MGFYLDPSEYSDMKKGGFTHFRVPRASSICLLILLLSQDIDTRETCQGQTFSLSTISPQNPFLGHCSLLLLHLHLTNLLNPIPVSKLTQTSKPRSFPKRFLLCLAPKIIVLLLCNSSGRFCLSCSLLCHSGPGAKP